MISAKAIEKLFGVDIDIREPISVSNGKIWYMREGDTLSSYIRADNFFSTLKNYITHKLGLDIDIQYRPHGDMMCSVLVDGELKGSGINENAAFTETARKLEKEGKL